MTDLIRQIVTEHGIAAALGIASLALQLWVASKLFTALSDQNRATARLLERVGLDSEPPPLATRRRAGILPRAPTPPPFWPVDRDAAVPEAVDPERSEPLRRPRGRK